MIIYSYWEGKKLGPRTEEHKLKISKGRKGIRPRRNYFVTEKTKLKIANTLKEKDKFRKRDCLGKYIKVEI